MLTERGCQHKLLMDTLCLKLREAVNKTIKTVRGSVNINY
jgi:hypothetical protein